MVVRTGISSIYIWATSWQNQQNDCAQQRLRSAWAFAQSDQSSLVAKDPSFLHADREDWSDWADAQADLSLRWVHMPFCWFCHEAALMVNWDFIDIINIRKKKIQCLFGIEIKDSNWTLAISSSSPLWEMVQEGIDIKTIKWSQHWGQ